MNCAYCASALPVGATRCEACGARRATQKSALVEAVLYPRASGGRPFRAYIFAAFAISMAGVAVMFDGPENLHGLVALWALLGLPILLLVGVLRTGLRKDGRVLRKLGQATGIYVVCLIFILIGFAP